MGIKFQVAKWRKGKYHTENNTCFLVHENWNDFGYNYLYEVHYTDNDSNFFFLGETRIMSEEPLEEILKRNDYKCLDDNCVSLGLYSFYENLLELEDGEVKKYLLESIKDCIYNPKLYEKFKEKEGMDISLLRNTYGYEEVYKEYSVLLNGEYRQTPFNLDIKLDSNNEQTIKINVVPESTPPTNIHAIIGRNASGKTQLLEAIIKYYQNYNNNILYDNNENTIKNNIYKNFKLDKIRFEKIVYIPHPYLEDIKDIDKCLWAEFKLENESLIFYYHKQKNIPAIVEKHIDTFDILNRYKEKASVYISDRIIYYKSFKGDLLDNIKLEYTASKCIYLKVMYRAILDDFDNFKDCLEKINYNGINDNY